MARIRCAACPNLQAEEDTVRHRSFELTTVDGGKGTLRQEQRCNVEAVLGCLEAHQVSISILLISCHAPHRNPTTTRTRLDLT